MLNTNIDNNFFYNELKLKPGIYFTCIFSFVFLQFKWSTNVSLVVNSLIFHSYFVVVSCFWNGISKFIRLIFSFPFSQPPNSSILYKRKYQLSVGNALSKSNHCEEAINSDWKNQIKTMTREIFIDERKIKHRCNEKSYYPTRYTALRIFGILNKRRLKMKYDLYTSVRKIGHKIAIHHTLTLARTHEKSCSFRPKV